MNIKELKLIISDLPDDMEVVGSGHFGEKLDVYYIEVGQVGMGRFGDQGKFDALVVEMEGKGDPPD